MKLIKKYKTMLKLCLAVIITSPFATYTQAETIEVERLQDSDFYKSEPTSYVTYLVDNVAQLCFFEIDNKGYVLVPCANLKKRPEWKNKITW